MRNKKAQTGIRELVTTLVVAGILFSVGVLIFANVTNVTERILDSDVNSVANESVTVTTSSSTVVNETITMTAQRGTVTNPGVNSLTFFGNGTNNSFLAAVQLGLEVNYTRSGRIIVDGDEFPADGLYNVTYAFESNSTATIANDEVTDVTFFGNGNMSTGIAGIAVNNEVNFTGTGVITLSALNFTSGDNNISYTHNSNTAAQITTNNLQSTVLDSFSLGVIALIVLAAVVILGVLFTLGSQ